MRTEAFQLNYAKVDTFTKLLTDDKQRILSKRGSAVWDPRTNQLFIQDIPCKLEEVRRLVAKVDIPVRQVMIEARIVEASDTFSKNLGARLGYGDNQFLRAGQTPGSRIPLTGDTRILFSGNRIGAGLRTFHIPDPGTRYTTDSYNVMLPAQGLNSFNPGSFAIALFRPSLTRFINMEISALEADGKDKVIASPRVLTADQVEAVIEQGTEIPYQSATSSRNPTGMTLLASRS